MEKRKTQDTNTQKTESITVLTWSFYRYQDEMSHIKTEERYYMDAAVLIISVDLFFAVWKTIIQIT